MRKFLFLFISIIILSSCNNSGNKVIEETYPDGSTKVEKYYKGEGTEKELVKEVTYYDNKQKMMEGEYKDSKRDGDWVYYYKNGNKWSEGTFVNGLGEGKRSVYYENGEKRYEGNYSKGEETGVWKFWDENGKLQKTIDYDTVGVKN